MSIGDLLQRYIRHLEKRTHGRIDGQNRIREQSYENYLSYSRAIWNFDNQRFADGFGKRITVLNKNIIDYKIENVDRNFLNEFLNYLSHIVFHKCNILMLLGVVQYVVVWNGRQIHHSCLLCCIYTSLLFLL